MFHSGSAGFGAVMKLRELGYDGGATLITNEGLPLDRTKLSKALITDASKLQWKPAEWYKEGAINIQEDEVSSIDFKGKSVSTKSGKSIPYTKLILATGGIPKNLPLPGFKDLGNIFLLRQRRSTYRYE